MTAGDPKGNYPERWDKLLQGIDERLQLGLLDQLKKVAAYHFEEDVLYIEPSDPTNQSYLMRSSNLQQLQILAAELVQIERVKIKSL